MSDWFPATGKAELRKVVPVTADPGREASGLARARSWCGLAREHPLAQVRQRHDVPFEALGGVDREDLDSARHRFHGAGRQAVLAFGGGGQVVQQFDRAGAIGGEFVHHVGEGVQVRPARSRRSSTSMSSPVRSFDVGDQIGQRNRSSGPGACLSLRTERPDPLKVLGRVGRPQARIEHGVDQTGQRRPPTPSRT